ncbi:kinase [Nocardia sp. NPDC051832]|uniref:kinase n=1 Tax=Nocardia sp. NPDC051832 TaxID=3155673 RepID=UPI0034449CF8
MNHGLLLYGPPASGKDTVTATLTAADSRFQLYERFKAGPGRTVGYRMVTEGFLNDLAASGQIAWENSRYGARYVIDRPTLVLTLEAGSIPVVHAGQPEVVDAIREAVPEASWTVVELTCSRETAQARSAQRATGDTAARMAAWDATPRLRNPDLVVNTDQVQPTGAAQLILRRLESND